MPRVYEATLQLPDILYNTGFFCIMQSDPLSRKKSSGTQLYCHGYQLLFRMPGIQQLAALQLQMYCMHAAAPTLDAPACCAWTVHGYRATCHRRHTNPTQSERRGWFISLRCGSPKSLQLFCFNPDINILQSKIWPCSFTVGADL